MNRALRLANKFAAILQDNELLNLRPGDVRPGGPETNPAAAPGGKAFSYPRETDNWSIRPSAVSRSELAEGDYTLLLGDVVVNKSNKNYKFIFSNENRTFVRVVNVKSPEFAKYMTALQTNAPVVLDGEKFTKIEKVVDDGSLISPTTEIETNLKEVLLPKSIWADPKFRMSINDKIVGGGVPLASGPQYNTQTGELQPNGNPVPLRPVRTDRFGLGEISVKDGNKTYKTGVQPEFNKNDTIVFLTYAPKILGSEERVELNKEYKLISHNTSSQVTQIGDSQFLKQNLIDAASKIKEKADSKLEDEPNDLEYKALSDNAAKIMAYLSGNNFDIHKAAKEFEILKELNRRTTQLKAKKFVTSKILKVTLLDKKTREQSEQMAFEDESGYFIEFRNKVGDVLFKEPISFEKDRSGNFLPITLGGKAFKILNVTPVDRTFSVEKATSKPKKEKQTEKQKAEEQAKKDKTKTEKEEKKKRDQKSQKKKPKNQRVSGRNKKLSEFLNIFVKLS